MKMLCRLISFDGTLYAYDDHPVFEVMPSGRIVCGLPEADFGGLKPGRVGQFNQRRRGGHVLICLPEDLERSVAFFLAKAGPMPVVYLNSQQHPNWDERFARAARRRLAGSK